MRISDWSSDVCSSDLGLSIATYLVTHLCGGSASEATRAGSPPAAAKTVTYDPAQCLALAGVDVGDSEQKRILESLGFAVEGRSEERRVGKECVSTCRSRWSPDH